MVVSDASISVHGWAKCERERERREPMGPPPMMRIGVCGCVVDILKKAGNQEFCLVWYKSVLVAGQ